jgi:hypothetical protein
VSEMIRIVPSQAQRAKRIKSFIVLALTPLALLIISRPTYGQAWASVLSPSRAIDWSKAGVQGGIPSASWTQCGSTIAAYGSSGSPASPATIANALVACSGKQQYVLLGPGNFYLSAGFEIDGLNNVELRGSGANSTFLYFYGQDACDGFEASICIQSTDAMYAQQLSNITTWTAGYTQGTNAITLASVCPTTGGNSACLVIGNPIILAQKTSTADVGAVLEVDFTSGGNPFTSPGNAGPYANQTSSTYTGYDEANMHTVVGCNGSTTVGTACSGTNVTVTIDPPLIEPNWSAGLSPQAYWASHPPRMVGVQNLTIDNTNNGAGVDAGHGIFVSNAVNFWIQGVKDTNESRAHFGIQMSSHGSIRNNYMFLARNCLDVSYGIDSFSDSSLLIENNISQAIASPIMFNENNSGNVVSYNYALNDYFCANGWHLDMTQMHAVNDDYNLYEGNVGPGIDGDVNHGTHQFNTFFRNRFAGTDTICYQSGSNGSLALYLATTWGTCTQGLEPVKIYANNRFFNVIGNVLGTAGATPNYLNQGGANEIGGYVLNIGSGSSPGGGVASVPADSTVPQTTLLWGNCDNTHGFSAANCQFLTANIPVVANLAAVQQLFANLTPTSNALPQSFYYSSQPSWWPTTKPWPIIGPDVNGGNIASAGGMAYTNPAEDCYNSLTGATANGTGGPFPFDANTCYGSSVATQPPGAASGLNATGH